MAFNNGNFCVSICCKPVQGNHDQFVKLLYVFNVFIQITANQVCYHNALSTLRFVMIKLYGFGRNLGLIDASPFVAKVHTFLRIAGLEYTTIKGQKNLGKSPKNKLPFIEDNGDKIGDSRAIIEYLTKKHSLQMDSHLSPEDKANSYLIEKSLDENLYWCLVWSRWIDDDSWKIVKPEFFKGIPFPLSAIVPNILRKKVKKSLYNQGMGRHTESEIVEIANQSFNALSVLLGNKPYFYGNKVSTFDASAYAFISSFTHAKLDNETNKMAKSYVNLVTFVNNIKQQFFNQ